MNGSGSSRNRPETLLASLPYIDWGQYGGKKCLLYRNENTHALGTTHKLNSDEVEAIAAQMPIGTAINETSSPNYYSVTEPLKYKTNFYTEKYEWNRILFGAPGTGKSWELNKDKNDLLSNGGQCERVTFIRIIHIPSLLGHINRLQRKMGIFVMNLFLGLL